MVVLKDHIHKLEGSGSSITVLATMEALEYVFKFIVRSRVMFAR
jgi:hypothetical protein